VDQDDGQTGTYAERSVSPTRIVADPRKFSEYVLVPDHPSGKDRVFLGLLGYRPQNEDDARELAATYVEQAGRRWAAGDVMYSRQNEYGRFFVIVVELRGIGVRSVWIHRNNGELALATPFRGFASRDE
jgi:hypothetical protein